MRPEPHLSITVPFQVHLALGIVRGFDDQGVSVATDPENGKVTYVISVSVFPIPTAAVPSAMNLMR